MGLGYGGTLKNSCIVPSYPGIHPQTFHIFMVYNLWLRTLTRFNRASKIRFAQAMSLGQDIHLAFMTRRRLLAVWDILIAGLSVLAGYYWSPAFNLERLQAFHANPWTILALYVLAFPAASLACGLYDRQNVEKLWRTLLLAMLATFLAWASVISIHAILKFHLVGRWIVLISSSVSISLALLPRLILGWTSRSRGQNVLLLGGKTAENIILKAIKNQGIRHIKILKEEKTGLSYRYPPRGKVKRPDMVVVEKDLNQSSLDRVLSFVNRGVPVMDLATFMEDTFQKVPVETIDTRWFLAARPRLTRHSSILLKRGFDLVFATAGLLVSLPIWPLISLGIKMSGPGPIFYIQERVGKNGKHFFLIKFRSMRVDAEKGGRSVWAKKQDPRATGLGRWLRRSHLDELPQFLNILKGDMSLVGPRPERPDIDHRLARRIPHYHLRHLAKPGLTGWAQVMYSYGGSLADAIEKLRYDLFYIKYGGFMLDGIILLRTFGTIFKGSR